MSASSPVNAEPVTPAKKQVDTSALKAELEQITKKYPYNTSVAVIDLNSGSLIQSGDTYPYVAASTTKLLTALLYFKEVEQGSTTLEKPIAGKPAREQLKLMINRSDNPAWQALNSYLGKNNLEDFAHAQGLKSFNAQKNTVTSDDMARLLAKIYQNESISKEHTDLLLSWMQKTQEERFIPSAATPNLKLYHKAGYLPDRVHDVAIIDNGSAPFVLVIYSKSYTNDYNNALGQKLFKQVTSEVIETFNK